MFDSEARFIELLLHELTHTTFYFPSSADFNEAFASWMGFQAALAFVDQPKSSLINREDIKAQLQRSHRRQLKAAPWIQNALRKTRDFYEKGQVTEAERVAHFEHLARSAEKEGLFKVPASRWNNAFLLSLGTYYEMVPSIDAYAENEKLSPPDFLKRITARGPGIIPEIMKSK
jgi:predicted aminopeptidase